MSPRLALLACLFPLLASASPTYRGFSVVGRHVTTLGFSGSGGEGLDPLGAASRGPMFLFERDGVKYVVRDPAVVAQAEAAVAPQDQLGTRQDTLGAKQQTLADRQTALGDRMNALAQQLAGAESDEARRGLADRMRELGEQMRALGEAQKAVGDAQRELDDRERAESLHVEQALMKLADATLASGKASKLGH